MPFPLLSRRELIVAAFWMVPGATLTRWSGRDGCVHGHVHGPGPGHPPPRPGIDASRVLTAGQLKDTPEAIAAFDEVRQVPHIVDGIRCHCGCAGTEGLYSLLSCYEGEAMARHCQVCRGQGRYAFRLHKAGKSLDQIRAAIDARYD